MTTAVIQTTEPRVRVRTRVRQVDVSAPPEQEKVARTEAAKAKALDYLQLLRTSYDAKSAADKALKELAALNGSGEIDDFVVEFNGKTYDGKVVSEEASEVSVEKLSKEVELEDLLKMVKTSQGAVTDFGGKTLLNKVLISVTKDPEFKVKARK